jgi:hypothetical protein
VIAAEADRGLVQADEWYGHEAAASLRWADGDCSVVPLERVTVAQVAAAVPFRRFGLWRGQKHMPGLYGSATTRD